MRPQGRRAVIALLAFGVELNLAASDVTTVAVPFPVTLAQTDDGTIWAGTDGDGLWYSNDVVRAWKKDSQYEKIGSAINIEQRKSWDYWNNNKDYQESEAKRIVGFAEAYLYHCCYGKFPGRSQEPVSKKKKE